MKVKDTFLEVEKYFSPRIIGEVNDHYIKVAKIKGQKVPWHSFNWSKAGKIIVFS